MIGQELIERLIDDLQKSIKAKSVSRSREQLHAAMTAYSKDFKIKSTFSIEESWISLTCDITFPYELGDISQFINHFEQLVSYKSGDKVVLQNFLDQLLENKNRIAIAFQRLNENPNLTVNLGQTLFSYLKEKLDNFHNEALSVYDCYKILTENK